MKKCPIITIRRKMCELIVTLRGVIWDNLMSHFRDGTIDISHELEKLNANYVQNVFLTI